MFLKVFLCLVMNVVRVLMIFLCFLFVGGGVFGGSLGCDVVIVFVFIDVFKVVAARGRKSRGTTGGVNYFGGVSVLFDM